MIYQILKQLQINSSTIENFKHKFKILKLCIPTMKCLLNYLNQFKSMMFTLFYAANKIFYINKFWYSFFHYNVKIDIITLKLVLK